VQDVITVDVGHNKPPVRVGVTRTKPARPYPPAIVADFEMWFSHYPRSRRVGKARCLTAYVRARAAGVGRNVLLNAVHNFRMRSNPAFIPPPEVWLNRERWTIEAIGSGPDAGRLTGSKQRKDLVLNDLSAVTVADNGFSSPGQSMLAEPPALEPWLIEAVRATGRQAEPPMLTAIQRWEAGEMAQAYRDLLVPRIAREALTAWLEPLCNAVSQPPSAEMYEGRVQGVLGGAADLPLAALNPASQAAAWRRFTKWPAVSDLIKLLEEQAGVLRRRTSALTLLSRALAPAPATVERGDAAKAAVSRQLAALRDGGTDGKKPRVVSSHLTREQLRQVYELQAASADPVAAAFGRVRVRAMDGGLHD
jgi:hypothetical protein